MHINIRGEKTLTVRILIRDGTSNFVHENIIRWIHAYALTVNSYYSYPFEYLLQIAIFFRNLKFPKHRFTYKKNSTNVLINRKVNSSQNNLLLAFYIQVTNPSNQTVHKHRSQIRCTLLVIRKSNF